MVGNSSSAKRAENEQRHTAAVSPDGGGGRYLGVDLHGEEEPEAGVGLHGVQLLLQLHQPAGGQVDVLQHHPPARLHCRVDVPVSLVEALRRT